MKLTRAQIENGRTPKGGFTRKQLAAWGVPWPPPSGWIDALTAGEDFGHAEQFEPSPVRTGVLAHDLLRDVVLAVVSAGHAADLYDFPDVLAYFGAQLPDEADAATAYGPATKHLFEPIAKNSTTE